MTGGSCYFIPIEINHMSSFEDGLGCCEHHATVLNISILGNTPVLHCYVEMFEFSLNQIQYAIFI